MLSVKQFKKRVRRTTEKAFEDLFAETLAEKNIFSRHMSDRFSGVFDRYVSSGIWVELKSLEYARGLVPHFAGMTVEQKRFGEWAAGAGDEAWYLALIHVGTEQFLIFCPYHCMESNGTFAVRCDPWCQPYDGKPSIRKIIPKDWYI